MKRILKKLGKIAVRIVLAVVLLLVFIGGLLTLTPVQSFLGKKAADFLSSKMETTIKIDQLRINFSLQIEVRGFEIYDQKGGKLICAKYAKTDFPIFKNRYLEFNNVVADSADVRFFTYQNEDRLNLQFFINFFKKDQPNPTKMVVNFKQLQLTNSKFELTNENKAGESKEGIWNYSNMVLSQINTKISQMIIVGDSLNFYIDQLQAKERSGFEVTDFNGHLRLSSKQIYCFNTHFETRNGSQINTDFGFDYQTFQSFKDFNTEVLFNSTLFSSKLNTKDLTYFVPAFSGMQDTVRLKCIVQGSLSDLKIKKFQAEIGEATQLSADVELLGLPNIKETFIDLNLYSLYAQVVDIKDFSLPKGKAVTLPKKIEQLGWLKTKGHFLGLYDNFFADADFSTAMGGGNCELMFNAREEIPSYDGKVNVNNLLTSSLTNLQSLNNLSAELRVAGKGLKIDDMETTLEGKITNIDLNGIGIKDINLNGVFSDRTFEGSVLCQDSSFNIDFNGNIDLDQEEPSFHFVALVNNINLSELKLFRPDSNACLSTQIYADVKGKELNLMQGLLNLSNIVYTENGKQYPIDDLNLRVQLEDENKKNITLRSNIIYAKINGTFLYKEFLATWKNIVHQHLPSVVAATNIPDSILNLSPQNYNFNLNVKQTIAVFDLFLPNIKFKNGLHLTGFVNQKDDQMQLNGSLETMQIKNQVLNKVQVVAKESNKNLQVNLTCEQYKFKATDTIADLNNIDIRTKISGDSIDYVIAINGNNRNKMQDILFDGIMGFNDSINDLFIQINSGSIVWNGETFILDTFNHIKIRPNYLFVDNFGISTNQNRSFNTKTVKAKMGEEYLAFDFNNIELGMANLFLNRFNIDLQGNATGVGGLYFGNESEKFTVGSFIKVHDFYFNEVPLGYLDGRTSWHAELSRLNIKASIYRDSSKIDNKILDISGYLNPKEKYIDLNGITDNFNFKILQPYVKSFANKIEGFCTGKLSFKGPLNNPKLIGSLIVESGTLGIDYLKTEYFIRKSKIDFIDTGFIFSNFVAKDQFGNTGIINGYVSHQKLRNWGVNLMIRAENLMALNTTVKDNSLFYGKAFASGIVNIRGKAGNLIAINADVITNEKTDISLLFDWSTTADENNFITFVSKGHLLNEKQEKTPEKPAESTGMAVNLKIKATPEATIRVYLDPTIGGSIFGKGNANMELNIDRNYDFTMYGTYTLSEGVFNLAYGDILTRTFKLQNGGTLAWSGDPMEGQINIKAIQSAKVSINNLLSNQDESSKYRPISVNNILSLTGDYLSPEFSFTFEMPDADENVKNIVYNSIDTSDREEMVKQMISVLFLGMFESGSNATSVINSGLGYSISELVSHQLNRLVSSISEDINVGVAYRNDEQAAESEYSVDLGGSFLNNRLDIRTTFGLINQQDIEDNERFLGDVIVEYKITPNGSLKVKAFNITNELDRLQYTSRYSQGIGLSFSKDFNTLRELFTRKKKRKEQAVKNENQTPSN